MSQVNRKRRSSFSGMSRHTYFDGLEKGVLFNSSLNVLHVTKRGFKIERSTISTCYTGTNPVMWPPLARASRTVRAKIKVCKISLKLHKTPLLSMCILFPTWKTRSTPDQHHWNHPKLCLAPTIWLLYASNRFQSLCAVLCCLAFWLSGDVQEEMVLANPSFSPKAPINSCSK